MAQILIRKQKKMSRDDIPNNLVCATSKVSDQPAHTRSLIRAIPSRLNILCGISVNKVNPVLSMHTGPRSAVGNVSGFRCVSDCRSRGREFDPSAVPYFCGDWSWNNFDGLSPPFRWIIQEWLLSVTSQSMCTNYWLTACSSLSRKRCG